MMNKQQIEQWARDADCTHVNVLGDQSRALERLQRFAALVAAHERDQCALVCDAMGNPWRGSEDCSAAIRQRNNQQSK